MRRELLLIEEMIEAAGQAESLVKGIDVPTLNADRQRRDALLWNFTVLGEAAAQLDDKVKTRFPEVPWGSLLVCATASSTATGRSIWRSCTRPRRISCPSFSSSYGTCSRLSRPRRVTPGPPTMMPPVTTRRVDRTSGAVM